MGLLEKFNWFGFGQKKEPKPLRDDAPVFIGILENSIHPKIMEIMFYKPDDDGQIAVELASIVDLEAKEKAGSMKMGQKFEYTYINSGLPASILICEITSIDQVSPLVQVPKNPFELVT